MDKVEVRDSGIEGKGVFAIGAISAGEIILNIDDSHIVEDMNTLTEYQKKYECDWLGDDKTILMQAPEKHINHSCDPNTYVKTIDGIREVIALRDIEKGEEITYDYAINGYYDSGIVCHCGSQRCRGMMNADFFKLPKELQKEYFPYLDNWFKEKFKKALEEVGKSIT
ncbi:SET domain-containing protein-lysine N-methyltransferase [Candidatus Kaiserbacteria bacterium]|nr:SET domain-containing protein-lysine N-methyltransferase [Candidatus Kaiserbacteria bacterium]